ncbi:MAG: hypothetical protein JWQ43_1384, partial [Glaciihabitans sp.]|nr:hypothetical protein [Glaciihabitans sp.]
MPSQRDPVAHIPQSSRSFLLLPVQTLLVISGILLAAVAADTSNSASMIFTLALSAVLTLVSVVAAAVPAIRRGRGWLFAVAMIDVVIIALWNVELYRVEPGLDILVIIPVLWLTYAFRTKAMVSAILGTWLVTVSPFIAGYPTPTSFAGWGTALLSPMIISVVGIAVHIAASKGRRQRLNLRNAYDELRVSIAKGLDSTEALRVSVADGIEGAEALRVSVADGLEGAEALRVSVADGLEGAEALRVSVADGLEGAEALRISEVKGANSAEALRISVADGLEGAEALRVSEAQNVDSTEALRLSVADGLEGAEALRVSVADGLEGAEALRISEVKGAHSAEALRISVADGLEGAEALRVSEAQNVDSTEALRLSVADGLEGAEALRLSVADGLQGAEALRESEVRGFTSAAALQVSIAQGLDAASTALAVVDTVDAGITFYDPAGVILLTNDTAREFLVLAGSTASSHVSQAPLIFEDDRVTPIAAIDQIFARAARGELVSRRSYWIGSGDDQRAVMATSQYVRRISGELIGTVVATHDVTPLAAAIRSRDDFLTTVSHELRTPLTSVIGYLELIEDTLDLVVAGIEHEFTIVQRNSQRLLGLINDLLTTAEGQASLERRPFNVAELAENSLNAFRTAAADAGVVVRQPELVPVMAEVDAARISEVFDKLLSNAVKFNRPGGEISLVVEQDDDSAVVRFSDTGIGISEADLGHIFERFFRSSTAR